MPPNRKNTGLFTSNAEYESLNIPIQSKFLPLTDSRSEAVTATAPAPAPAKLQQQQHHPVAVVEEEVEDVEEDLSYSYWDTPSDIPVEEEKDETIDDLFSLTRIESNLITDSIIIKTLEEESTTTITLKQQQEPESYWTWSNDTDKDWNDTYYDNTIGSKSVSVSVSVSTTDKHCEDCCQDYWAWDSSSAGVVDVDESDNNDDGDDQDDVVMTMAAATTTTTTASTNNNNIRNVLTKSWRKHKHLPEPEQPAAAAAAAAACTTASTSEHYWHWQEFHSKSCSVQVLY